jgi:hypothetical protein
MISVLETFVVEKSYIVKRLEVLLHNMVGLIHAMGGMIVLVIAGNDKRLLEIVAEKIDKRAIVGLCWIAHVTCHDTYLIASGRNAS